MLCNRLRVGDRKAEAFLLPLLYFYLSYPSCFVCFLRKEKKEYVYHSFFVYIVLILSRSCFPSPLLLTQFLCVCSLWWSLSSLVDLFFIFFLALSRKWAWTYVCGEVFPSPNIIYMLRCDVSAFRCVLLSTFRDFYTCWCILYSYRGNVAEALARCKLRLFLF